MFQAASSDWTDQSHEHDSAREALMDKALRVGDQRAMRMVTIKVKRVNNVVRVILLGVHGYVTLHSLQKLSIRTEHSC